MADRAAMAKAARLYRRRHRKLRRCVSSGLEGEHVGELFTREDPNMDNVELGLHEYLAEGGAHVVGEEAMHEVDDGVLGGGNVNIEPYKGMEFETYKEAFSFYNDYARNEGFGVTKRSSHRSLKDNEFIDGKFVCSRYGKKQNTKAKYPRSSAKIECKASMHVKKREDDGKWYVYNFIKEHNHELLKGKSHLFRSHRKMKIPTKNNTDDLCDVGVQTDKFSALTSSESCRYQDGDFLEGGVSSKMYEEEYLDLEVGDAEAMHEYFIHMQEENPYFFYALDFNKEQCLRNVFWIDAKGRHDYIHFRDVILFDTTYVKNKYKMPFAPFIGVNHHGQLTLLGCALIVDETMPTFLWLMRTWLKAMGGEAPQLIITDQDRALKATIAQVLPSSRHCFCLWHIMRQIPEKLSHISKQHKNFMEFFYKCINRSWTGEEFERRWHKIIAKFELNQEWFQWLYDERRRWVPTYMKNMFFAGLSTLHRSESISSSFDRYIMKKTTLKEFLEQYETALSDRFEKEAMADFQTWHTKPALNSPSPYEFQLSSIYTREIFKKFQVEVMGTRACSATKQIEDGSTVTYRVNDLEQKQEFTVTWNAVESDLSCLCRSFEFNGFLCRHAMLVLQFSGVFKIPSHYILRRWTKDVKRNVELLSKPNEKPSSGQFCSALCHQAIRLADEGSLSEQSYRVALSVLEEGMKSCAGLTNPANVMQIPGDQLSLSSLYW